MKVLDLAALRNSSMNTAPFGWALLKDPRREHIPALRCLMRRIAAALPWRLR